MKIKSNAMVSRAARRAHTWLSEGLLPGGVAVGLAALAALLWTSPALAEEPIDPKIVTKLLDTGKISATIIVIATAAIGARLATAFLDGLGERFTAKRLLLKKFASLSRFLIYIAAVLIAIFGVIEPERETLIALGGTLAIALGLALKDLTSSIIAGVIVLIDSPFQVGDRVQYGSTYGEVVEIGLRTIKINTLDDNLVSIPNNKFLSDEVASANAGELDMMVVLDFFIALDSDLDLAREIVFKATVCSRYVYLKKPVSVMIEDVTMATAYTTRVRSKFYVADTRYETAIKSDTTTRVKRAFRQNGIHPPYHIEVQGQLRLASSSALAALPHNNHDDTPERLSVPRTRERYRVAPPQDLSMSAIAAAQAAAAAPTILPTTEGETPGEILERTRPLIPLAEQELPPPTPSALNNFLRSIQGTEEAEEAARAEAKSQAQATLEDATRAVGTPETDSPAELAAASEPPADEGISQASDQEPPSDGDPQTEEPPAQEPDADKEPPAGPETPKEV